MNFKKNLLIKLLLTGVLTSFAWLIANSQFLYEQFDSAQFEIYRFIRDDGPAYFARGFAIFYLFLGLCALAKGAPRLLIMSLTAASIFLGMYSVIPRLALGSISSSGGSPKYVIFWCLAGFVSYLLLPISAFLWQKVIIKPNPSKILIASFCLMVPNILLIALLSMGFICLTILVSLIRSFV